MIIPILMFRGLLYLVILFGFWSANEKPPAKKPRLESEAYDLT